MKNKVLTCFIFFFVTFSLTTGAFGQEIRVTFEVENIPINQLLAQLSSRYNLRFAFDDDLLSKQKISLKATNLSIEALLEKVLVKNGFGYRMIGGTYVVVKQETHTVEPPLAKKKPRILQPDTIKSITQIPKPKTPVVIVKEPIMSAKINAQISGFVSNALTGEKLRYCRVVVNLKSELETNEMGYFFTRQVLAEPALLTILHLGYKRLDTLLMPQQEIRIDLALEPISVMLDPINIKKREKFLLEMPKEAGLIAFNPVSTLHMPRLESNDLVNSLTLIPGINFISGQNPGLGIRGGSPTENLVLLDGIPVLETSHLFGNLSVLNSKYIQQVSVSRGGFGAEYGGRVAGIIDMNGKNGSGKQPTVDLNANLLNINGYAGIPLGPKFSLSGAFRQSINHFLPTYLYNKLALNTVALSTDPSTALTGEVDNPEIWYRDINAKVSFRPNSKNEFTINYLYGDDSQVRNFLFPTDGKYFRFDSTEYKTSGYSAQWGYQTGKKWSNYIALGFNKMGKVARLDYGKEPNKLEKGGLTQVDYDNNSLSELLFTLKSELKYEKSTHLFGGGYTRDALNYHFLHGEWKSNGKSKFLADSITASNEISVANAFYQGRISLFSILTLKVGLRADYNMAPNQFNLMPRAGFELEPIENLKFSYRYGQYKQYLYKSYRIDIDNEKRNIWYLAGENSQTIGSTHHIAGLKYEKEGWLFNLEAYSKQLEGKCLFLSKIINDKGFKYVVYEPVLASGLQRGVDLFMQYRHGIFHHLLSYSLSESLEKVPGFNLDQFYPSSNDQRHVIRMTEMVNFRSWSISGNWYFATGGPVEAVGSNREQFLFDRLPYFSQLDLSVVKQFKSKLFVAEVGATLLNLFNRENVLTSDYFRLTGDNTDLSVKSEITALSFTPVFFINLKY